MAIGVIAVATGLTLLFSPIAFNLYRAGTSDVPIQSISELPPVDLDVPNLVLAGAELLFSPLKPFFDFILQYLITPLILIGFTILFFLAQYWLFKLYFKLGKAIFTGIKDVMLKIHFTERSKELLKTFTNTFS